MSSTTPITGSTSSQVARTDPGGSLGQDAFLKLLVAQMQNQDPMAPTDSSTMMTQEAQFTSVEQLTQLSSSMTALQLGQDFNGAVSLIGHNVTYEKADGTTGSGLVSAVKPTPQGALLTVGSDSVLSGNIQSVTS
jgi:flagellar basal-body rod modification protein FlgD